MNKQIALHPCDGIFSAIKRNKLISTSDQGVDPRMDLPSQRKQTKIPIKYI